MSKQETEPERNAAPVKLSQELADSLAKLAEARIRMPEVIPAPSLPVVRLASSNSMSAEPPITKRDMAEILGPMETIYLGRQLSAEEVEAKYLIYFQLLKNLSRRQLAMAAERYLRSTNPVFEFFPKPAHLLDLAKDRF